MKLLMRIETVWVGRGGQGIVTATYIIANASIIDGFYAIANPEFGAERRGLRSRPFNNKRHPYRGSRACQNARGGCCV